MYYHIYNDKIFPMGIEYQVRYNHVTNENHTGDFWAANTLFDWSCDKENKFLLIEKGGKHIDRKKGEHRGAEVPYHYLDGKWNKCEVIVMDSTYAIHLLNGVLVNFAQNMTVGKGIIGLQSETAEIFYRNIEIKELDEFIRAKTFLDKL